MVNIRDACLVFYVFPLRTMTESTGKILKLYWKTPGFFLTKEWGGTVRLLSHDTRISLAGGNVTASPYTLLPSCSLADSIMACR